MSEFAFPTMLAAVNSQVQTSLRRLRKYLERVERDLASGDHGGALSNLAELSEISRRLWNNLAKVAK
jgi:hypothetical protein